MTFELPDSSGTPGGGSPDLSGGEPSGNPNPSLDNGNPNQPIPQAWDSMPKSWKRDYENDWKAAPEGLRKYAHQRESEYEQGVRGYATQAGRWSKAYEPLEGALKDFPDVDPVELYRGLAQNHLALVQADPSQRRELFLRLAQNYGVDFATAAADGGQGQQAVFSPQQMQALQEILSPIKETTSALAAQEQTARSERATRMVDSFFSDPKNEFANEVGPAIFEIIKSGVTTNLNEAYELAVFRNPEVKAKYLQSLASRASGSPSPAPSPEVKGAGAPPSSGRPATMDGTIKSVIDKHYKK